MNVTKEQALSALDRIGVVYAHRGWQSESLALLRAFVEQAGTGYTRYEYIRTLNPQQFAELWMRNINSHGPFDSLVDQAIASQRGGA